MTILNDPGKNFIHALSSFWTTYFVDADMLRAYYEGVQVNMAQAYLDLLQTILGTSLRDMPLFSRHYFKYVEVPRSRFFFTEGATADTDGYLFTPTDYRVAGATAFINKVLAPTASLTWKRDFTIQSRAFRFTKNLFASSATGGPEPLFPVKYVTETAPAVFVGAPGVDWFTLGARIGDFLRFQVAGGAPVFTRIIDVQDNLLYLDSKPPTFEQDFSTKTVIAHVARTPYENSRAGELLRAQPATSIRLSTAATDASLIPGTKTFTVAAEPFYRGAWTFLTAYTEGDVVSYAGTCWRAKTTHTAGATFNAPEWTDLVGTYFYVSDSADGTNCGLGRCTAAAAGVLTVDRVSDFLPTASNRAQVVLMTFAGAVVHGAHPSTLLPVTLLDEGSVAVLARRAQDVYATNNAGATVLLPAGAAVVEGVDYLVDYVLGSITFLTPWAPAWATRVNYTWLREVAYQSYVDPVDPIFLFSKQITVPVLALWATDLLVDDDALFNNFGYLLDFQRPTSEQYRTFLRGVAQLFLLGPSVERFESAMNVLAELPVVREDGEVLLGYDDGVAASGADGQLFGAGAGRDGTLDGTTGVFSAPSAAFYPSDVGAQIFTTVGSVQDAYVIVEVRSSTSVRLAPAPPTQTDVAWTFEHNALSGVFRTALANFEPGDVGASVLIKGSNNARNNGCFKIASVENASTVRLETPYGFDDETGLTWILSRKNVQTVTTTLSEYALPLQATVRDDIANPANFGYLTLRAFESLTTSFQVVDYIKDPAWWHHVVIPEAVLQLETESVTRRRVSPEYIEHVYGAVDGATFGDFGVAYGVNDEAMPGLARQGSATWFGGNSIVLAFPSGAPAARVRDVGSCLVVATPGFEGSFPILAVSGPVSVGSIEHAGITLDRFPPPEAAGRVPAVTLDVTLPPLLYRRTVAFVMMDRFLKYHAIQIRIDKDVPLPDSFIPNVTRLVAEARPSHTYIYLDSSTDFTDRLRLGEDFVASFGPYYTDFVFAVDNTLRYGLTDGVRYGDAFYFDDKSIVVSTAPGTTLLPVTLPSGDVQATLVKVRFDSSVRVDAGTYERHPAEDVDYSVNYETGELTIRSTAFTTASCTVFYIYCVRRLRSDTDPLLAEETRCIYGGANPRVYRAPTQTADQMGLVDRAVQITLGP